MFHRDHGTAVHDAFYGEPDRRNPSRIDVHHGAVDRLGRHLPFHTLGYLVQLYPELIGQQLDWPAPDGPQHAGKEERRDVLGRRAEPEADAGELGIVIRAVIADLLY